MRWTIVKEMNAVDHDLKEMNEVDQGLKKVRLNVTIEVNNVTRAEVRLSDYVMM